MLNEFLKNDDLSYWQGAEQRKQFETLFENFSVLITENASLECFDVLSAEIATLYLELLQNFNDTDDLTRVTKILLTTGGDINTRIKLIHQTTQTSIILFKLAARDMRLTHENEENHKSKNSDPIKNIINAVIQLLAFIQPSVQSANRDSFSGSENSSTSSAEFEEIDSSYKELFEKDPTVEEKNSLSIVSIIKQYNRRIEPYLERFVLHDSLAFREREHASKRLTDLIAFPFRNFSLPQLSPERYHNHLNDLISLENGIMLMITNVLKIDSGDIPPLNGFLHAITARYSHQKSTDYLEKFHTIINGLSNNLKTSLPLKKRSFTFFTKGSASQDTLMTSTIKEITHLFADTDTSSHHIAEHIGRVLNYLLRSILKHQTDSSTKETSLAELDTNLLITIDKLLALIEDYHCACDPFFVHEYKNTHETAQPVFSYPIIVASEEHSCGLALKSIEPDAITQEDSHKRQRTM